MESVMHLEYVLDSFDKEERKRVETEINDGKDSKRHRKAFVDEFHDWKVVVEITR